MRPRAPLVVLVDHRAVAVVQRAVGVGAASGLEGEKPRLRDVDAEVVPVARPELPLGGRGYGHRRRRRRIVAVVVRRAVRPLAGDALESQDAVGPGADVNAAAVGGGRHPRRRPKAVERGIRRDVRARGRRWQVPGRGGHGQGIAEPLPGKQASPAERIHHAAGTEGREGAAGGLLLPLPLPLPRRERQDLQRGRCRPVTECKQPGALGVRRQQHSAAGIDRQRNAGQRRRCQLDPGRGRRESPAVRPPNHKQFTPGHRVRPAPFGKRRPLKARHRHRAFVAQPAALTRREEVQPARGRPQDQAALSIDERRSAMGRVASRRNGLRRPQSTVRPNRESGPTAAVVGEQARAPFVPRQQRPRHIGINEALEDQPAGRRVSHVRGKPEAGGHEQPTGTVRQVARAPHLHRRPARVPAAVGQPTERTQPHRGRRPGPFKVKAAERPVEGADEHREVSAGPCVHECAAFEVILPSIRCENASGTAVKNRDRPAGSGSLGGKAVPAVGRGGEGASDRAAAQDVRPELRPVADRLVRPRNQSAGGRWRCGGGRGVLRGGAEAGAGGEDRTEQRRQQPQKLDGPGSPNEDGLSSGEGGMG